MNLLNIRGNWIDLVIILILAYFLSESWRLGFWVILADFLGFLLSLAIALLGYSSISSLLQNSFSLPRSLSNALGFLFIAGISEAFFGFIFAEITKKIPYRFWKKPWSSILATIPSLGQGIVLIAFILTLTMSLPIIPKVKADINESWIGGILLEKTSGLEVQINQIFGGILEDSLTYLTVKPGSQETIPLDVEEQNLTVDEKSENQMLQLINEERRKRGINELSLRTEVVPVARDHARDMWERKYFGHVSPEGEDVGDRLEKAEVSYSVAGENLALAPTIQTAHSGLMKSEGHKKNILDPEFRRVGIGVIDNEVYGKMFVQVFTN